MSFTLIAFDITNGVATIRLDQEANRNALSAEMVADLHAALLQACRDPEVRAILLTGTGKAFCAGGDVKRFSKGWTSSSAYTYMRDGLLWLREIVDSPKPVIAAVNGAAFGAGLSMALASDVILAAESAQFGMVFSRVGLVPDGAAGYFLPRIVGLSRAKELTFSGRVLSAREASDLGIVLEVVPDGELTARARKMAEAWASAPTIALGQAKELLNKSANLSLQDYLAFEAKAQAICLNSEDHSEGVRALLEKRQPRFQGK